MTREMTWEEQVDYNIRMDERERIFGIMEKEFVEVEKGVSSESASVVYVFKQVVKLKAKGFVHDNEGVQK